MKMSSNSIRISNQLFRDAQTTAELLTRSTAQQVEHWARIGQALELSGASGQLLMELLQGELGTQSVARVEDELRAEKRIQQAKDIAAVETGAASASDMIWLTAERAKKAKALDSPY